MTTAPILLDNTVLTNFALVGRPDFVLSLWGEPARITPAIQNEYQVAVAAGLVTAKAWADPQVVILTEGYRSPAYDLNQLLSK